MIFHKKYFFLYNLNIINLIALYKIYFNDIFYKNNLIAFFQKNDLIEFNKNNYLMEFHKLKIQWNLLTKNSYNSKYFFKYNLSFKLYNSI